MPGIAVNGVAFEPALAEVATRASGERYRVEALPDVVDLGLDMNNARVQPNGRYRHHGVSAPLVDVFDEGFHLVHVGFAAGGFLIHYSLSGAYEGGEELSDEPGSGTDCDISGQSSRP